MKAPGNVAANMHRFGNASEPVYRYAIREFDRFSVTQTLRQTCVKCMALVASIVSLNVLVAGELADSDFTAMPTLKQSNSPRGKIGLPVDALEGPVIPGLEDDAVPQGLAYLSEKDWFLISLYVKKNAKEKPSGSFIVAVDAKTEKLVLCRALKDADGKSHCGHVGGIAVDDKHLWVGSENVYRVPLKVILEGTPNASVALEPVFKAKCKASFLARHDGLLWVGEFVKDKGSEDRDGDKMATRDLSGNSARAWLAGYALGANGEPNLSRLTGDGRAVPDVLFAIPEHAQGVTFHDNLVLLSTSYGRCKNRTSTLHAFKYPLADARERPIAFEQTVPVWFLAGGDTVAWMRTGLPPMAEGIAVRDGTLAVLFESGANLYCGPKTVPIRRLVYLKHLGKPSRVSTSAKPRY